MHYLPKVYARQYGNAAHKTCQFVQLICLYCSKKAHAADIDTQQGLMKTDAAPCGM